MIKHIIDIDDVIKVHTKIVEISKKEVDEINRLLSYEDLESMSDEKKKRLGCKQDYSKYIFGIEFDDGTTLDWWLCSGTNNYYDNVVFTKPFTNTCVNLDCVCKLDDIEIEAGTDVYRVLLFKR